MDKVKFEYVSYISGKPEKIWKAVIDPRTTKKYWQHENVSDWKPGSKWMHKRTGKGNIVDMTGRVREFSAPRRLVLTWVDPADEAREEKHSLVTIEVEPYRGVARLKVTHENLEIGSEMFKGITEGWPMVISSLKSLIETGKALPVLWREEGVPSTDE